MQALSSADDILGVPGVVGGFHGGHGEPWRQAPILLCGRVSATLDGCQGMHGLEWISIRDGTLRSPRKEDTLTHVFKFPLLER